MNISFFTVPGTLATALAILVLGSCSAVDYSGLTYHSVSPQDCDPSVPDTGANNLCGFNSKAETQDTLVVFLPGTAGSPAGHQLFLKEVALSHPVIGLEYPNDASMGALCGNDLDAYGPAREEICTGRDTSSLVTISPRESIEGRLKSLLGYLCQTWPDEGWDRFLVGGTVDGGIAWSKVMLAGYSQGAGHAGWLAQSHELAGVLLFSGIVDASVSGTPRVSATWIQDACSVAGKGNFGATPLGRFRFFVHTADGFLPGMEANLNTMGFDRATWDTVDDNAYDAGRSPVLSTSWFFADPAKAHPSTCEDASTPKYLDGSAVFRTLWSKMLNSLQGTPLTENS